jgi:hypothetical protein
LRERPQPRVRLEERFAPGPAAGEVEAQPAGVAGEAAGDVEEPVAETLRLAAGPGRNPYENPRKSSS